MKNIIKRELPILFLIVVTIAIILSIIHDNPLEVLKTFLIEKNFIFSTIIYFFLVTISTIFSSITIAPIIPFISKIFGPWYTFIMTFLGVLSSSIISFWIAKKFGKKIILKYFCKIKLERLEKKTPRNLNFFNVIFFRFFTSPDSLSYFLGLYSKLNYIKYLIATAVGISPIIFILSFGPEAISSSNKFLYFLLLIAIFIILFSYLFYQFLLLKKIKLVTHSGVFHSDDLFAAATLALFLEKRGRGYKIIRTRNKKDLKKYKKEAEEKKEQVYIFDIGGEYNEKLNFFDHHQQNFLIRENDIPYSSFGLVWKKYGEKLSGSKEVMKIIDKKICLPIDAIDNGVLVSKNILDFKPYDLNSFQKSFFPLSGKLKDFDKSFLEVVKIYKNILEKEIKKAHKIIRDEKKFNEIYNKSKEKKFVYIKDFLILPKNISDKYPELLFTIQKGFENGFIINTIKSSTEDPFARRKYFPKSWSGKKGKELEKISGVSGATFCHKGIFIAGANNLEAAIKMTEIAIKEK